MSPGLIYKKVLPVLAVVTCFASASAQISTGVASSVAGIQRIDVPRGGLVLARYDYESFPGAASTAGALFGSQLPVGSKYFAWDPTNHAYVVETNLAGLGWSAGTNGHRVARTEGFWLSVDASATAGIYSVFISGVVPSQSTAATTTVANIATGSTLVGYAYPKAILWTNTQLARAGTVGEFITMWNATGQYYEVFNLSFAGWGAGTNLVIAPGVGFWVDLRTNRSWVEAKPYSWP